MAKKIMGYIKLQVPAGSANPSPPDRTCARPARPEHHGVLQERSTRKTQDQEKGMPIPVTITVFSDKSFTFEMKTPPASYFLKKAAKLESRLQGARPRSRRLGHDGAGARDREGQDEGPERQRYRGGGEADRRLGSLDGHRGEAMSTHRKTHGQGARRHRSRESLSARRGGEAGQGPRQRRSSTRPSKSR